MKFLKPGAEEILTDIRLLILDVDGVMTDGHIIYDDAGRETKIFDAKDGFGIRLLQMAGLKIAIATGRMGNALKHRCRNLNIDLIFEGLHHKAAILGDLEERTGVHSSQTAFVGDDLLDISLMQAVALPIAVADARKEVIESAAIVTQKPGGHGAVREVCEAILQAQGTWPLILEKVYAGNLAPLT